MRVSIYNNRLDVVKTFANWPMTVEKCLVTGNYMPVDVPMTFVDPEVSTEAGKIVMMSGSLADAYVQGYNRRYDERTYLLLVFYCLMRFSFEVEL